jgi:hypothetical protein
MTTTTLNTNTAAVPERTVTADPAWSGLFRAGGLAMLIAGLLYLLGSTAGVILGVPPGDSEAYFFSLVARPDLALLNYWLFALAAILLLPAVLGLYQALKGINRSTALVAAGLAGFFTLVDFAVTELSSIALATLARDYALAPGEAGRAMALAAAHWGLAIMPVATFFSYVGPASGFFIMCLLMLKGVFGKPTARLGLVANGLGALGGLYFLFPLPLLSLTLTPILLLYGAWLIVAGRGLRRLGRPRA